MRCLLSRDGATEDVKVLLSLLFVGFDTSHVSTLCPHLTFKQMENRGKVVMSATLWA